MAFNLKNRHLLSLVHHSEAEIRYLLNLARDLKRAKYDGTEQPKLKGKNIALILKRPPPVPAAPLKSPRMTRAPTSPILAPALPKSATRKA